MLIYIKHYDTEIPNKLVGLSCITDNDPETKLFIPLDTSNYHYCMYLYSINSQEYLTDVNYMRYLEYLRVRYGIGDE